MLPVYVYVKDDTPYVTFKCEGCGLRFPSTKLYGRTKICHLNNGKCTDSTNRRIITMVCSRACAYKTPQRTLRDLLRYLYKDDREGDKRCN
jgi:hypothetical protein